MLRERNGWTDVVVNWIMLGVIILPLASMSMLGATWVIFQVLGVYGVWPKPVRHKNFGDSQRKKEQSWEEFTV